jgi:hypothetical protein
MLRETKEAGVECDLQEKPSHAGEIGRQITKVIGGESVSIVWKLFPPITK